VASAFQSCYVSAFGEEWSETRHFPLRKHANITILCEKLHADFAHGEEGELSCDTACTSSLFSELEVDSRIRLGETWVRRGLWARKQIE
jgi:hypothetical protein